MAKVHTENVGDFYQHYPRVATVLTTHARGRDNAMALAWHAPLSRVPPLYGVCVGQKRFTYELILESEEFGVNFVPFEMVELVRSVGASSGRDVDKFARLNIAKEALVKTKVPILKDAYAAYECKLVDRNTYGDHDWLVGEIVAVHFLEEAFAENQMLDLDRAKPILYIGTDCFLTPEKYTLRHLPRDAYEIR